MIPATQTANFGYRFGILYYLIRFNGDWFQGNILKIHQSTVIDIYLAETWVKTKKEEIRCKLNEDVEMERQEKERVHTRRSGEYLGKSDRKTIEVVSAS